MSKMKLLLDVVSDLRSLADSLQAVADAVAQNGQDVYKRQTWAIVIVGSIVAAVVGIYLSRLIFKKHLIKAGIL